MKRKEMVIRVGELGGWDMELDEMGKVRSTRFGEPLARNKILVEGEIKVRDRLLGPYQEFQRGLVERYGKKGEDGRVIMKDLGGGQVQFELVDFGKYMEEWGPKQKEMNDYLDSEVRINMYMFRRKYLPEDLSGASLYFIMDLIDEEEEGPEGGK